MRVVLDGVFNHTGRGFWPFHHVLETGAGLAVPRLVPLHPEALDGHRRFRPYPWPRSATTDEPGRRPRRPGRRVLAAGLQAWWGLPALPKLNTDNPEVREYLFERRRALAPLRHRRLAAGRADRDRDDGFWQEFRRRCRAVNPDAYLVGEIWQRGARLAAGDRFDALMNYPLAEAILGLRRAGHLDEDVVAATTSTGAPCTAATAPRSGRSWSA